VIVSAGWDKVVKVRNEPLFICCEPLPYDAFTKYLLLQSLSGHETTFSPVYLILIQHASNKHELEPQMCKNLLELRLTDHPGLGACHLQDPD
jgi:hypothetical protein